MKTAAFALLISSQAFAANVFDCTVKQIVNNPQKMTGGLVKDCGKFEFDSSLYNPKDTDFESCPGIIVSYTPHAIRHGLKALVIGNRTDDSAFVAKEFPANFVVEFSRPLSREKTDVRESYEMECAISQK